MDYGGLMTIHDHTEPILVLHSVAWTLGDIATKDKRPVGLGGVHSSIRFFSPKDLGRGMTGNDQDEWCNYIITITSTVVHYHHHDPLSILILHEGSYN